MRLIAIAGVFALALLVDVNELLALPVTRSRPLLFAGLAAAVALRRGALAGGAWGFSGGVVLGALFQDRDIGARALAGLAAGSLPVGLRGWVYVQRWSGQAATGALAGAIWSLVPSVLAWLRTDAGPAAGPLLVTVLLDALLTGAVSPLLGRLLERVERRV